MPSKELQQQMYGLTDRSMKQRATLAVLLGLWVALACWILLGGGLTTVGARFGVEWQTGNPTRCAFLFAAFSIFYVRILGTTFVFLRRGMSWSEVFTIAPWVLFLFLLLGISGGLNPAPIGLSGVIGTLLFLVGSWMNSWGEFRRHVWKKRPENKGKLYTQGVFSISRHPNYLGDLISFSGLCVFAGRWFTWIVPVLMFALFAVVNIPVLDAHLKEHYGAQFDAYAEKTRKLIPFVY
jgi:protein-S-isoprenylcysteine O-methyltransferase Ste14